MEFIDAPKRDGCIFCDFPAEEGEAADRRNLVVHRSPMYFTILNRFPYNSGHVMVVPRAHLSRMEDLRQESFADLHEQLRLTIQALRVAYRPEGFNIGMNLGRVTGAVIVDHLHYHVVPR